MSAPPPPPAADAPMVEFDRVSRRHGSFRLALNDVSFRLARGQCVLLQGPHGAGKTTLLRLVAALDTPSSGRVVVAGRDLATLQPRLRPALRQSMGIVLQEPRLLDDRSVLDNVMLPAQVAGLARAESVARAEAALARCGFDAAEAGRASPAMLSGGDRVRVALARALVNRPALLLIDEPLAQLASDAARAVIALLVQFAAAGVSVLIASRDERALWPVSTQRWSLHDGRLELPAIADAPVTVTPAAASAHGPVTLQAVAR